MAKQTFTTGQVLLASQLTSLQQTAMLGGSASAKTASYTLAAADAGTFITMSSTSATTITVNTGLFAAGDIVTILNTNSGVCTITAGTATVSKPTNVTLALVQNAGGVLYFTATGAATFMPFDIGSSTAAFKGCSLYKNNDQTIATAAFTAVEFNSESFDTDAFHSTSSNISRITIPSGLGGKYLFNFTAGFTANTTGIRGAYFYKNGTNAATLFQISTSSAADTFISGAKIFDLVATDYIELYVYQTSGGNLNLQGTVAANSSFACTYLGA